MGPFPTTSDAVAVQNDASRIVRAPSFGGARWFKNNGSHVISKSSCYGSRCSRRAACGQACPRRAQAHTWRSTTRAAAGDDGAAGDFGAPGDDAQRTRASGLPFENHPRRSAAPSCASHSGRSSGSACRADARACCGPWRYCISTGCRPGPRARSRATVGRACRCGPTPDLFTCLAISLPT